MEHRRAVWQGLLKTAKGISIHKYLTLPKYLLLFNKAEPASLRNVIIPLFSYLFVRPIILSFSDNSREFLYLQQPHTTLNF